MFDIGFLELCVIAVIALLVFGPEKLPGVARSAGLWVGRARRLVTNVKQEIDRELKLQEVREAIHDSEQNGLHQFIEETKSNLSDLQKPLLPSTEQTDSSKNTIPSSVNSPNPTK